jgi:hypothetical protein
MGDDTEEGENEREDPSRMDDDAYSVILKSPTVGERTRQL